ncbi:MAG: radical SAM protein [Dehalococcoidia bacterium]|jgi:predicted DNA-binding helix-hairpin-helix protein
MKDNCPTCDRPETIGAPYVRVAPDTHEKLSILSQESQYDLACACGVNETDARRRSRDDRWIYPVTFENGRKTFLFKTLVSNECLNDCRYCPLRVGIDSRRCTLTPDETSKSFLEYYRARRVQGIFLTSGMTNTPDDSMDRIISTASILRRGGFRGYMHLKVIPGASDAAIEQAVALASAVSINIETAGEEHFKKLGRSKNYLDDIIRPMKLISKLTEPESKYSRVHQTTQFVVGASDETDSEIVKYSWGLYKRLGLNRVYFSAYQRGLGDEGLPGERSALSNADLLNREHRLYQTDWLIRKYGFSDEEIPFESDGNLSLTVDPKELWAMRHPEMFPIDINRADKFELLRVPGLGPVTVNTILRLRKNGDRIRSMDALGRVGKRLGKAQGYVKFGY